MRRITSTWQFSSFPQSKTVCFEQIPLLATVFTARMPPGRADRARQRAGDFSRSASSSPHTHRLQLSRARVWRAASQLPAPASSDPPAGGPYDAAPGRPPLLLHSSRTSRPSSTPPRPPRRPSSPCSRRRPQARRPACPPFPPPGSRTRPASARPG